MCIDIQHDATHTHSPFSTGDTGGRVCDTRLSWFCISKTSDKNFQFYLKRNNMTFHSYQLDGVKCCVNSEVDESESHVFGGEQKQQDIEI
jgi:hypothetical protein